MNCTSRNAPTGSTRSGSLKTTAAHRKVPFGKFVANTLKEWKLASLKSDLGLVFRKGLAGRPLANIINRGTKSAQPGEAKYTGMHVLRHFYARWCIDRGLPPKVI